MVRRRKQRAQVDLEEDVDVDVDEEFPPAVVEDDDDSVAPSSSLFPYARGPETAVLWTRREAFGPYVRALREAKGLSLRAASAELFTSFTYLHKLETGGRIRAPSPRFLSRVAEVFGRDVREVYAEAGFDVEVPKEVGAAEDVVDQFLRLVTHPALRPVRMRPADVDHYPHLHIVQWLSFARKLEAHVRAGGASVDDLVSRRDERRRLARQGGDAVPGEDEG